MSKKLCFLSLAGALLVVPFSVSAQQQEPVITDTLPVEEYFIARVVEVITTQEIESGGYKQLTQQVVVEIESGERAGERIEVEHGGLVAQTGAQKVEDGDRVALVLTQTASGDTFFIAEQYRLPAIGWILALFLILVLVFGRLKGLGSIMGLVVSISVLVFYIVPRIIQGGNPLWVSFLGAVFVAVVSLYLAHGFNKRTSVALLSTLITLGLSLGLAVLFVSLSRLTGFGSEEAFYVRVLGSNLINLKGLLLGGIIIGALGVLDDITASQSAAVDEISKANPKLSTRELYQRGVSVGKEHIASLVNTLVFAYAGASFPLLLLFTINDTTPLWVTLNSELVAEEIVRTLVGSTALIFAVPITTLLAAYFLKQKSASASAEQSF